MSEDKSNSEVAGMSVSGDPNSPPSTPCDCTKHLHCPRCHGIEVEPMYGRESAWCLECNYKWAHRYDEAQSRG
jgi:hypothetical protein